MIKILALANKMAEILIHEEIGQNWFGDGLTSKAFIQQLQSLGEVDQIKVRINSPGGAVSDGIAIYNALKSHGAHIDVVVEGLAASIASIIAMSGNTITMGQGAQMMIHSPWTFAIGNSEEMRKTADVLDQFENALLDIYTARSSADRNQLRDMLKAETWLSGEQAKALGLADVADNGGDQEAAALIEQDHRAKFANFAKNFRQPADVTPQRIAAVLISSATAEPQESIMTEAEKRAAEAAAQEKIDAGVRAALVAERERRAAIRDAFRPFGNDYRDLRDECMDDAEVTAEAASKKLLAKVAEKQPGPLSGGSSVHMIADSRDNFRAGAQNAINARLNLEKIEVGNQYAGRSIVDIAEMSLNLAGVSTRGLTKDGIARKALATMTTSDFPVLLSNTAGKVLRVAFDVYPQTYRKWCAVGSVSDFKIHPRVQIGSFNDLATVSPGGEFKQGSLDESYENAQAITKGRLIVFTRQMIVNDDLGGLNRRAQLMGAAAARTMNNDAYTYLTGGSGNNGPTSTDGGQLFNATAVTATPGGHANLKGSSGAAPSIATISVGRQAMQKQKDAGRSQTLNIQPAVLLVPVALEDTARTLMVSETDPAQNNSRVKNIYQGRYEVVADPALDDVSTTAWYLLAGPDTAAAVQEKVFLDGIEVPFIDENIEFDTDAMEFKVRLDAGDAMSEWRGGYRNVGA